MDAKGTPIEGGVTWVCVGKPVKLHSDGLFIRPQTFLLFLIMTQTKTGAFPSMGSIPQLFGHTVLAASMLAGGAAVLNAGGAMAAPTCNPLLSVANAAPGTGTFSLTLLTEVPPLPLSSACSLTSSIANRVALDVDLPGPGSLGPLAGTYTYKLSATAGEFFYNARIDSDVNDPGGVTVKKEVFSDSGFTQLIWNETSTDGSAIGFTPFIGGGQYADIYVRDTYTIPNSSTSLNVATNVYNQTPGPLPILGAGAAFGFSRKLRGRIKAARLG